MVDASLEDVELLGKESTSPFSLLQEGGYDCSDFTNYNSAADGKHFDLPWLKNACDIIVKGSSLQLPQDELAMAICRVLYSEKPGNEIAGDLLDVVGDGAFETVQDIISHRKELVDAIHHGLLIVKSDKTATNTQSRMPSYGPRFEVVTVQTQSERKIDKLRCKEETRNRCGTEYGFDDDLSASSLSSLLQASEKKSPFDDLIGSGEGSHPFAGTALPQGTARRHYKGYEQVIIPPTPTAPMKPVETLLHPI
ncbi:U5 small nuclear ribonucleoprotein helicase [Actinidia rufa]|uniref:U5 small nuclear ribonucleoprotein helicase n=1 Tax=Actinidia rufa TaxID=165716 RepID=A0A7J0H1P2_9ERIC|nr:U5 small nuclear ribonucleoprotein helicase [Actinidia rufa]